jgi:hypothetical protein
MRQQDEIEPTVALAAALAAMADAARHSGGGMRTVGRRTTRAGTAMSRRALANAVDSGRRANYAYRIYRGVERPPKRRPREYVAVGIIIGTVGAMALAALGRALARRSGDGSGGTATRRVLEPVRAAAGKVRRRVPPTAEQSDVAAVPNEAEGVRTVPAPATRTT